MKLRASNRTVLPKMADASVAAPATVRFPAAIVLAEDTERLLKPTTKTLTMSRAVIDALLEADADRVQSETLRAAVKVACEENGPVESCDMCGDTQGIDSDPIHAVEWICASCLEHRNDGFGVPSAWDAAFSASHDDREDR